MTILILFGPALVCGVVVGWIAYANSNPAVITGGATFVAVFALCGIGLLLHAALSHLPI